MIYFLIIAVLAAIIFVLYTVFMPSKSKLPIDGFSPDTALREQESSRQQQDISTLKSSLEKAELNYSLLQKEVEAEKKAKAAIEEELKTLKDACDKQKSDHDLLKVENASLKGKLLERDRDNRKLIDELKVLKEKTQPSQPTQSAKPSQPTQASQPAQPTQSTNPSQPAQPLPSEKPPQPTQPAKPAAQAQESKNQPAQSTVQDFHTISDITVNVPKTPAISQEASSSEKKEPQTPLVHKPKEHEKTLPSDSQTKDIPLAEPEKNIDSGEKKNSFKLVGEDEDDDKTEEDQDIQDKK